MERPPSSRPPTEPGAVGEIQLDGEARPRLLSSFAERALIGLFAIALGAGVIMGLGNLFGAEADSTALPGETPTPVATATESPSLTPLPEPSGFPTPRAEITPEPTPPLNAWLATAEEHRSQIGERFTYECPPEGSALVIWGATVYTDDSSVCTAAVHMGLISVASGGTVTIEMRPGRGAYSSIRQNGITSQRYPRPWPASFVFVE
jgi:hypothetical protein